MLHLLLSGLNTSTGLRLKNLLTCQRLWKGFWVFSVIRLIKTSKYCPFKSTAHSVRQHGNHQQINDQGKQSKNTTTFVCTNNIPTTCLTAETCSWYFDVFSTVHHSIELFHQPTLMHSFLYSLTICLLHYYPRHVSSINMPIFRRKNCPLSASVLCRRLQRAKIPDAV